MINSKKNLKRFLSILIPVSLGILMISWNLTAPQSQKRAPKIKNVIFMIGDGMGLSAAYAAMSVSDHPLNIERCPYIGLQKSFSSDNYITDSAAAGTALASGEKTKNGAIGVDPEGNPVKSILNIAEDFRLATGLVAVTAITDVTPASFIAHEGSRGSTENIARDFLDTDIDLFIGGGYNYFAKRSDKLNLVDSLKARGYEVNTTMSMVMGSNSKKIAGLVYPNTIPYRLNGRRNMLPSAARKAIDVLKLNKRGFFLMVEGSHIDHGGHDNNQAILIDEVLDFDESVGVAFDFAEKDGHTLVIITADHETGGVTIAGGNRNSHSVRLNFSSKGHTAEMLPVYAFGPGAEKFTGIYDNTDIIKKIVNYI